MLEQANKLTLNYLLTLMSQGQYHFTTKEITAALAKSPVAMRAALRRLQHQNWLCSPFKGFYLIIPPEYRTLGCLPPEQFIPQLMHFLQLPYYVGLLSAAFFHGASHQQPQQFQIVTPKNRASILCGQVQVLFVANQLVTSIPTVTKNTPRGFIKIATPEATALDLIAYYYHCGGLNNVATVLAELAEQLDPQKLLTLATTTAELPWVQRLGYLLELVGADHLTSCLAEFVAQKKPYLALLAQALPRHPHTINKRWQLLINTEVEPDL